MLGVVHFLRGFFKIPETATPLPGEGASEDNLIPSSPADPEEHGWSLETDHDDLETLSHHSESQSDTKNDLFDTASDTGSLASDITGAGCCPPRDSSIDGEASWGWPSVPTDRPSQDPHLPCVPGLDSEKDQNLSLRFEEESHKNEVYTFAAVAGDCVTRQEPGCVLAGCSSESTSGRHSPQTEKRVTVGDLRGLRVASLQKSRSESYLHIPVAWPFLLHCCELSQSWLNAHNQARPPRQPCTGWLDHTDPLQTRTKAGSSPVPEVDADSLWAQSCLGASCQPPLGVSCLLLARHHHSTPEDIGDPRRASPGHYCQDRRTQTRARSKNCAEFGTLLKERTETEKHSQAQSTLSPAPTPLFHLLCASQSRSPSQAQYRSSGCSSRRASQENRPRQDSRTCPAVSCLTSDLARVGSPGAVPRPAEHRPEHSPGSRPPEPQGAGPTLSPADASSEQSLLQEAAVESGSHTSNYTVKPAPGARGKPHTRADFPGHCDGGGAQVWSRNGPGCQEVGDGADVPETNPAFRSADTVKKAEEAMVLDLGCRNNAEQDPSEFPATAESHCTPGEEACGKEPGDGPGPCSTGLRLEPKAGVAPRGRRTLLIGAMEQKGLQVAGKRVCALLESQTSSFPQENPASPGSPGAAPCQFPRARNTSACGRGSAPPLGAALAEDKGALQLVAPSTEAGGLLIPRAASEALNPEEPPEEVRPGERPVPRSEGAQQAEGPHSSGSPGGTSGRCTTDSLMPGELHAACPRAAAGWNGTPPCGHRSTAPGTAPEGAKEGAAGLMEGGPVGTPGELGITAPSSASCSARRPKVPERTLWARLALAQKTFANLFELKAVEKEDSADNSQDLVKAEKKSRLRQSPWRALRKNKDVGGPQRPSSVSPLGPRAATNRGGCEECAEEEESGMLCDHWRPPHCPAPLSPSSLVSPEPRRKSEPTIKCTAPQEGGGSLPCSIFPEKSWLQAPNSPGTQQAGICCPLPCTSTCCLACGHQGMPCRPLSPKPHSPRSAAQLTNLSYTGRTSAISMVSLGSYSEADNCLEGSGRPKTTKARASLLLSLQTLNQDNQKAESRGSQCHRGPSTAPSLRDIPGYKDQVPWEEPPGEKPSCSHEDVPREAPSQPRRVSMDDLQLEKMQRKTRAKQVQVWEKMCLERACGDAVQGRRKMSVASPESLHLPRRSCALSQSAPTGLNHAGRPERTTDAEVMRGWPELLPSVCDSVLSTKPGIGPVERAGPAATWEFSMSIVCLPPPHCWSLGGVCRLCPGTFLLPFSLWLELGAPCARAQQCPSESSGRASGELGTSSSGSSSAGLSPGSDSDSSGVVCGGRGGMRGALSRAWSLESLRSASAGNVY
ncbi:uncharacterized protein LOC111817578 [Octodon degus]|uniref:Uncharacterized protein LOC111817578 n=1 Tax=Octodon degus TaxID=10160 RepID=A0A6P6ERH5_OCTDE|nr:uncharacterized protein LOC111817578 [Octodon degus]